MPHAQALDTLSEVCVARSSMCRREAGLGWAGLGLSLPKEILTLALQL